MATVLDTRQTKPRHPEKIGKPETPKLDRPSWLRVKAPAGEGYEATRALVDGLTLKTVCQEAACPNVATCWAEGHATFMILGAICTRACAFCNVATGLPGPVDRDEPLHVAAAIAALRLSHAVITSVDRDDLPDGGASHYAEVIGEVRRAAPGTTIEVLTPDFLRKPGALEVVVAAAPDVFNHNIETVPRLYPSIRPGARYFHSLRLLQQAKEISPQMFTKSGLMLGLGESREEVAQVLDDMRSAGVDFITLGQYLQPTRRHAEVKRFVPPEEFDELGQLARAKGFLLASSSPLTRSSFHAGADFKRLSAARRAANS